MIYDIKIKRFSLRPLAAPYLSYLLHIGNPNLVKASRVKEANPSPRVMVWPGAGYGRSAKD
jgi:hypothetical protein